MVKLFGDAVELVVKAGLLFSYRNEPSLAFWHTLEVLSALGRFTFHLVKAWRNRRQTRR